MDERLALIRRRRRQLLLTQAEVGALLGVTHSAVSKAETGERARLSRKVSLDDYAQLLDTLAAAETEAAPISAAS